LNLNVAMKTIMPNSAANHVQHHCVVNARRLFFPIASLKNMERHRF
jgi:hypothetical protein